MLNEFYKYIARSTVSFFQGLQETIRPGERFHLRLDTEDMVQGVDEAIRSIVDLDSIAGSYNYGSVYQTYTIRLSAEVEVVVASKTNGMTDDFLATLRNAELTEKHWPILMITHSPIDTITSGTADLSANGMPFHASAIISRIKESINTSELSSADRILLESELERKQSDRFSDKSSLFEYSNLLTVLGKGYVQPTDYYSFGLLNDPGMAIIPEAKIKPRLDENRKRFEEIERVFKNGNIEDDLGKDYDAPFIEHLKKCKRSGISWYDEYSFDDVLASHGRMQKKLDNPLTISDESFSAFSGSEIEYSFWSKSLVWIRDDGDSKVKQRIKNIIIFNPDGMAQICFTMRSNISVKNAWIEEKSNASVTIEGKKVTITLTPSGCTFSRVVIADPNNNIKYTFKFCVINLRPKYLESIQTRYYLDAPKNLKHPCIKAFGITNELIVNPDCETVISEELSNGGCYSCSYGQTLQLSFADDSINVDTGYVAFSLKCGAVEIPLKIMDESSKPTLLTGVSAFKWKHTHQQSSEYREGRIIAGTKEFYPSGAFKDSLALEDLLVCNGWLAAQLTPDGNYVEVSLAIDEHVRQSYSALISEFQRIRSLPSLSFYSGTLKEKAESYVESVYSQFEQIEEGCTLSPAQNDLLMLGTVSQLNSEKIIFMSPLHPLNVLYQLELLKEEHVGETRESLVEKLSPLYLLPYLKDSNKNLYHAVEQSHSPEWRVYAQISNKRFQGARNYVQKLVSEKIIQYKDHFTFLFDDLGNDCIHINLINMGDCREVIQGLIRFFSNELRDNIAPEDLSHFVINIYCKPGAYNEFSILSDQKKLRGYVETFGKDVDDPAEMALILANNLKCFFRNDQETEYQYAHLSFYEMDSSEESGDSRMDGITTGVTLGGLTSGTPSVLSAEWYKTGFGLKYAGASRLIDLARFYNALARVAYSGSSYEPYSAIFTEIASGEEGQLRKIYRSSNWVVFVDPKVDLSFFQREDPSGQELMIIHYSDQYTSASGYDDITVTQKSEQYEEIIQTQLQQKGVFANRKNVNEIINLFNAVNGGWMLRLISAKKLTGAADSNFSREKLSILSAIKLCIAYYAHPDIVWIPISLEEMLRVSGGAGYSKKDGLLSAKNLGFDKGATSDDILMVGLEGPVDHIKIYLHPVEVKIGQNLPAVLAKAQEQVKNTYNGLWRALWPEENRDSLECKLSRNFLMQLVIVCCEKMKLYGVYPDEHWDYVTNSFRENLLNEKYTFSTLMDDFIGKGTVVSFKTDALNKSGTVDDDVCLLELPEKLGSDYLVRSASEIEQELDQDRKELPRRLKFIYEPSFTLSEALVVHAESVSEQEGSSEAEVQSSVEVISDGHPILPEADETPVFLPDENSTASNQDSRIGMVVNFGTDLSNGQPLYWYPNDTNQVFHTNTGIIGTMGTGKTQFTKSLIAQLFKDQAHNFSGSPLGILIFDYKGDYNESKADFVDATHATILKPYHLPFNPLALTKSKVFKPLLPIHTANAFKDTLSKVYGLGPKQQNTLFSCITAAYSARGIKSNDIESWDNTPPTFDMVYSIYANDEDIKKTDSLAAAMDKLYQFQIFEGDPNKTISLFDLLSGVVVIDLSGYDSDIQSLIVAITLDLFYSQMQAAGSSKLDNQYRELTKLILVDEADNFMSEGFPALKKILKEGREFGVGTILSTQFLRHFGSSEDDYSKYILTWIVHNVADLKPADVEFVFKTEAKSTESQRLFNDIKALTKHQSIVKIGNTSPRFIKDKAFWELYKEMNKD